MPPKAVPANMQTLYATVLVFCTLRIPASLSILRRKFIRKLHTTITTTLARWCKSTSSLRNWFFAALTKVSGLVNEQVKNTNHSHIQTLSHRGIYDRIYSTLCTSPIKTRSCTRGVLHTKQTHTKKCPKRHPRKPSPDRTTEIDPLIGVRVRVTKQGQSNCVPNLLKRRSNVRLYGK